MKKALICGVSGQDGAYLAQYLLSKGYEVFGTSRDAQISGFANLVKLDIKDNIRLLSMAPTDFRSVLTAISLSEPDEIYNLSGQSSVGLSFEQPVETLDSISIGTLNLLEVIRFLNSNTKLYNACSSESFGDIGDTAADENTPFRPRSPYAVAKATAFWTATNYREAYNIFTCNGILFNHESPLRPERFVTKKIIRAAVRISLSMQNELVLGNTDIVRDWGWAPDYVKAMWLMLQQDKPDDFIVATGRSHSLKDFVAMTFDRLSLDWKKYLKHDPSLSRANELSVSKANPAKVKAVLGWQAECNLESVIDRMIQAEIEELES